MELPSKRAVIAFVLGFSLGLGLGAHYSGWLARDDGAAAGPSGLSSEARAEGERLRGLIEKADAAGAAGDHAAAVRLSYEVRRDRPDEAGSRPLDVERGARAKMASGGAAEVVTFVKFALATDGRRLERAEKPIGRRGAWPASTHGLLMCLGDAYGELAASRDGEAARAALEGAAQSYELVARTPPREARAVSPLYAAARLKLGTTYGRLGRERMARAVLGALRRDFPSSPEAARAAEALAEMSGEGAR